MKIGMKIDKEEAQLERQYLEIGMKAKITDVLDGVALHIPTLTKFVAKKFVEWPRRLRDCESFAGDLDAALIQAESKMYAKLPDDRAEALLRVTLWQAWENKYQDGAFHDHDCGIVVSGVKDKRELREVMTHAVGHIINHLAKGDLRLEDVSVDKLWTVFGEFSEQLTNVYLLDPLRRMGMLPEPGDGKAQGGRP